MISSTQETWSKEYNKEMKFPNISQHLSCSKNILNFKLCVIYLPFESFPLIKLPVFLLGAKLVFHVLIHLNIEIRSN